MGGTLAVAASILLVAFLRTDTMDRLSRWRPLLRWPGKPWPVVSLISTLVWAGLVLIGLFGDSDPLTNLLPLVVWTLFWVVLTLLHALFGNWWSWLNPWSGCLWLLSRTGSELGSKPVLVLPPQLGYLPAIVVFIAFAWFELVSLAPEDPVNLATVVTAYWCFTLCALVLFGERDWLHRGEAFSVFFRFISQLSPVSVESNNTGDTGARAALGISWPGARLIRQSSIHWSGGLFILVTLATVSFDGLNKTFWWLHLNGINPLAFAGRSSVLSINSVGLLLACTVLVFLYWIAVTLGWSQRQSATSHDADSITLATALGSFALAIMPISLAYHAAHFLTQLLVNGQYLVKNLSDPLGRGQNLFGTADLQVTTSFLSNHHAVEVLWKLQVLLIVLGHIASVVIAHGVALRLYRSHRAAVRSQWPLGALMVAYTLFGLWLLSTPTGL